MLRFRMFDLTGESLEEIDKMIFDLFRGKNLTQGQALGPHIILPRMSLLNFPYYYYYNVKT